MIDQFIDNISPDTISNYFRRKVSAFKPLTVNLNHVLSDKDFAEFSNLLKLGEVEYGNSDELLIFSCQYKGELTSRSSKHKQYDIAKKVLKEEFKDAAIFVFFDESGKFRFSLIRTVYTGGKRDWSTWKRYTYFIVPEKPNKTFRNQINKCTFDSLDNILKAFSIEAVTEDFYNAFNPTFDKISNSVVGNVEFSLKQDFSLLFVIRTIFIGFVQKRKWLGDDEEFLQSFWNEYKNQFYGQDEFYTRWLEPLFFEALNSTPGNEVQYRNNDFTEKTRKALKMAPYLNGELFKRKSGYDNKELVIPDKIIGEFFDFLFQYNFTIEENTRYDEDLELNPEFLGIIFERLVNKKDGAVYTPRTEVDFMCRISLVKWLQRAKVADTRDLFCLFFREMGSGSEFEDYQKEGDFSRKELEDIITLLKNVTICDPASGSGAFPVGMMQVINEVLCNLQSREKTPEHLKNDDDFERKKAIIANSLYGVEVKRWAVWINQLRLWLSLFVDIPAERDHEFRYSYLPLLPNLDFKIRQGDSIVQRIGNKLFPIQGHANILSSSIKAQITALKKAKIDFYYNRSGNNGDIRARENMIFRAIIDDQITEKKKELLRLARQPEAEQTTMFPSGSPTQTNLDIFKDLIEQLKIEIENLREEKDAFKEDHPLIWNIEFAEIFYDKGGFDIIIGNPPYVRQEDITDPEGKIEKSTDYKKMLQETIRQEFPKHFKAKEKIDGKSDLYTFFYLKSLRLLNETGIHTFICSNSWLDVGYGAWMQKFLLSHCRVHWIVDNHAKRSFATADVNTIISVMDAPVKFKKDLDPQFTYKFIAFKKTFDEVLFTETLLEIEEQKTDIIKKDTFRSFPVSIEKLVEEGSDFETEQQRKLKAGEYIGDKWGGKYLRAPDIFFIILEKGLSEIDKYDRHLIGERYLNTGGADGFFVLTQFYKNGNEYDVYNHKTVESEPYTGKLRDRFLKPLIKDSTKTERKINIENYDALCFVPNEPLDENSKKYIKWGELNLYNQKSVTKLQTPWYKTTNQMREGATIIMPRSFNDTFIAFHNEKKYLSLRYYRLHPRGTVDERIIVGFMNCTVNWLFFETLGNKSLGQGAMDFFMADFLKMKIPFIKDKRIIVCFEKIKNRKIKSIFIECGINPESDIPISEQEPNPLPDRKELDNVVFDALELTEDERKEVYRAVCQLVWNRISKAKSV